MRVQNYYYLVLSFVGIMTLFSTNQGKYNSSDNMHLQSSQHYLYVAHATSCQVYPSEYAFQDESISRMESTSANCRSYPAGPASQEHYIHCDGTQLLLADSNLGQEKYMGSEYYWWITGNAAQLLFIFPKRVSLTIITLHYYSDNTRGLPRLRFYAVPDNFNVWNATTTSYPRVDVTSVPQGGEPAGRRNVSINVNFNTKKVLMYKFSSMFKFVVSEVEFFKCKPISMVMFFNHNQ